MIHKAWRSIEEMPYCFSRSYVNFQSHPGQKNRHFWPELSVSGLELQFEYANGFANGFEMLHKA